MPHNYPLRNGHDLRIPGFRLATTSKSCYVTLLKIFNHLPLEIKRASNARAFKRKLLDALYRNPIYSLNEYLLAIGVGFLY